MSYKKTQFGTIPNHWEVKSLADIGIIKGRIGWRGYTVDDIKESGPYVLGAGDITTDNKVDLSKAKHLSVEKYEESPEIMLEKGDTLIVKVGSTIGKVGFFNFDNTQATINPNSVLFRTITAHPAFVYYYLCTRFANNFLISNSPASAQPAINQSTIKQMPVIVPPLNEQKAIANILSSLDDKIELNNKINKNLEELAQTLYKHWFVDFEFPNEEGLPYKSSGGKMIESEQGLIPEGWNIEPLGNSKISKLVTSGINEFNNEKIYLATADVTDTTITNRNTTITMKDKPSRANMQPRENTLWFAKMKNSRKLIRVSKNSTELISDYIFSTGFAGLYVKEYLNFVWTFLLTSSFDENKNGLASGTTQEEINNRNINKINLIVPKDRILNKFEEIFNDIYEKIEQNDNENQKLANLRDLLLPKLMSGEIRVPIKE